MGSVEQYYDRFSDLYRKLKMKQAYVRAVYGIDLNVELGEALALVWESGSWKATTGKLLVRLLEPSEGRIIFNENDITHLRGKIWGNLGRTYRSSSKIHMLHWILEWK